MTPDEVKAEIEQVADRDFGKELAPLAERLRGIESSMVFQALFPFAARGQDRGPAAPAAWLLYEVNPSCPIPLRQAIGEMLDDWDISIEEVPFYLAKQFGVECVRAALPEMRRRANEAQLIKLGTIDYWLGCYVEMLEYRKRNEPA